MADDGWMAKYVAKVKKALKDRTGEESMGDKIAREKAEKKKKKKKKGNPNTQKGPADTVKYN